jgi:hypothetical protein
MILGHPSAGRRGPRVRLHPEVVPRRLAELQGTVTVEKGLLFVRALLAAARETVTDRTMLRRLQEKALVLLLPDGTEREYVYAPMPSDGIGTGNGHPGAGQDTGHAPEPGSATPPSPGAGIVTRPLIRPRRQSRGRDRCLVG